MFINKYAIIDIDVDHGNGTQDIFYKDANVLFISIHRCDNGNFYPCTGFEDECGKNDGLGKNINIPLSFMDNIGDKQYLDIFDQFNINISWI